jgi:plastocyanin
LYQSQSPARRHRTGAPALMLALGAALLATTAPPVGRAAQPPDRSAGRTHTVIIEGMRFTPQTLIVRRGERVTWVNKDLFPHTVTAVGKFDSHQIAAGGSWTYVARKAGVYDYVCTLHVGMTGRLEVR